MMLFGARPALEACSESYKIFWLDVLQQQHDARSPSALKRLTENLSRNDFVRRAEAGGTRF